MNTTNTDSSRPWAMASYVIALLAIAAGGWGYMQWRQVQSDNTAITGLQNQVGELQQRLSAAAQNIREVAKPDLPLSLSFRRSLLGNGLVALFRNNSGQTLELAATFSSSATGQRREAQLIIPPGMLKEFGQHEGWEFAPGHQIALSNGQFRPASYVVP
jgi:hypothetical protein